MPCVVSLQELVGEVESQSDSLMTFLNRDTGEMLSFSEEDKEIAEANRDNEAPECQRSELPKIREALTSDCWLELPDKFDANEWDIMRRFSTGQDNEEIREQLLGAIHGAKAFRRFRQAIERLGIESSWYKFRQSEIEELVRCWLDEHGLAYR